VSLEATSRSLVVAATRGGAGLINQR